MATAKPNLFSWDHVELLPELNRLSLVLDYLPDDAIIQALERKRGKGRDDYPVHAMWNAVIAGIVFQHESIESLVRELHRNPQLLNVCGFDPLPRQKKPSLTLVRDEASGTVGIRASAPEAPKSSLPSGATFSRFLRNLIELEEQASLVSAMIPELRAQLMAALPEFGTHLGYDGKAIQSHSTGQKNRTSEEYSDPDADWGKHETAGIDGRTGKPWKKIKSWFGYNLHLIADTHYEIPVAFEITKASASESPQLQAMIHTLFNDENPALAERCQTFSADRGLDCGKTKQDLWDDYAIRPLIDTREMWREEKQAPDYDPSQPITRPLDSARADTIVHTEKGTLHCRCPKTGEQRDLAFQGFEADRGSLKYRCPAAAYGLDCEGQSQCHQAGGVNPGNYGRIVRINLNQHDRRIFTPTPHGSPNWLRGYNRRSALERINSRIDHGYGFEKHFIRGKAKMETRMGLALAVMMAMALGHVQAGREKQMRSLIRPIPEAA